MQQKKDNHELFVTFFFVLISNRAVTAILFIYFTSWEIHSFIHISMRSNVLCIEQGILG
jgi:hypothetical protein